MSLSSSLVGCAKTTTLRIIDVSPTSYLLDQGVLLDYPISHRRRAMVVQLIEKAKASAQHRKGSPPTIAIEALLEVPLVGYSVESLGDGATIPHFAPRDIFVGPDQKLSRAQRQEWNTNSGLRERLVFSANGRIAYGDWKGDRVRVSCNNDLFKKGKIGDGFYSIKDRDFVMRLHLPAHVVRSILDRLYLYREAGELSASDAREFCTMHFGLTDLIEAEGGDTFFTIYRLQANRSFIA
ncbi:MAG TPA: hypothetical protein VF113_08965 [Stellaceae bacterium]